MTNIRVVLGDPVTGLDLADPNGVFEVYASSDAGSTDPGNMVPITEAVESPLQDGTLVRWLRDDNRTVTVAFGVNGTSLDSLARAIEYQVVPLTKIKTYLTIYPPDSSAAPAVFEVHTSKLDDTFKDLYEVKGTKRRLYLLTLTAQPYVRSLNPVVSPALAGGGGAPSVIDSGNGAGGAWTSALGGSVTTGTTLGFPLVTIATGIKSVQVSKALSSKNFTGIPYVYIDIQLPTVGGAPVSPGRANCQVQGAASGTSLVAVVPAPTGTMTRFWFQIQGALPTASTSISFRFDFSGVSASTLTADNVTAQGDPPLIASGSPIRTIAIQGSQRTPASLRVANCTLLYTAPFIGYQTFNPAAFSSGAVNVPVTSMPIGGYLIVVKGTLQSNGGVLGATSSLTITTTITQGSTTKVVKKNFSFVNDITTTPGNGYWQRSGTFVVGSVPLPLVEVAPGGSATMTISVAAGAGGSSLSAPWVFWMGKPGNNDHCALTIPSWPTSGTTILTGAYTWIDTPTIDRPYPGVWGGTAADKSDATNMVGSMETWGDHQFVPGQGTIFVVGGQADLTYYPRWHSWPVALA